MNLDRDEALALAPYLSKNVRARISVKVLTGPDRFAAYVRAACALAEERGAWVDERGRFHVDEGEARVPPEKSAEHTLAVAQGAEMRGAVTALDRAMQEALGTAERARALVTAAYEFGFALSVELLEPGKPV